MCRQQATVHPKSHYRKQPAATLNHPAAAIAAAAAAAGGVTGAQPIVDREVQQDEAGGKVPTVVVRRTNEEMMLAGGCVVARVLYENGQEWHPVLPTGEQKCVKCQCKVSRWEITTDYHTFIRICLLRLLRLIGR